MRDFLQLYFTSLIHISKGTFRIASAIFHYLLKRLLNVVCFIVTPVSCILIPVFFIKNIYIGITCTCFISILVVTLAYSINLFVGVYPASSFSRYITRFFKYILDDKFEI